MDTSRTFRTISFASILKRYIPIKISKKIKTDNVARYQVRTDDLFCAQPHNFPDSTGGQTVGPTNIIGEEPLKRHM
jgi:hypothetical protein